MIRCGWIIGALLLTSQSAAAEWCMKTESGCLREPVDYLTVANRVLEARFLPDTTVYDTHCTSFGRRPD